MVGVFFYYQQFVTDTLKFVSALFSVANSNSPCYNSIRHIHVAKGLETVT